MLRRAKAGPKRRCSTKNLERQLIQLVPLAPRCPDLKKFSDQRRFGTILPWPALRACLAQALPQSARRNRECRAGRRARELDLSERRVAKRSQTRSHSRIARHGLAGDPAEQRRAEPYQNRESIEQRRNERRPHDQQRDRNAEPNCKQKV